MHPLDAAVLRVRALVSGPRYSETVTETSKTVIVIVAALASEQEKRDLSGPH